MTNIIDFEKKYEFALCANKDIIVSCLKKDDVFVDVGANTGLLTQKILESINFNLDKIILFEPVQYLADECFKKFGDEVIIERVGLSNVNEDKLIYASKTNLAYNKIFEEGMEIHPHEKEIITCVRFSDWVGERKIDFVKIDVEGHDIEVIEGMFDWLNKTSQRPYILFEGRWNQEKELNLISYMYKEYEYSNKTFGRDVLLIPKKNKTNLF